MEKSWVWLPRNSSEYEQGVTDFVNTSARKLGNPVNMLCPCVDCRNVNHQPVNTVVDHLVIKGMDEKYKRNSCWSIRGDIRNKTDDVPTASFEAYELFRTAFLDDGKHLQSQNINGEQSEYIENAEDLEFKKKLEDAETPLYTSCSKYTKVSAIMGLYRIKVNSGMSENYFDQLLKLVHDMLPEGNILPTSTDEIRKFLKIFGFGYDMIHACKNDYIMFRKEYADMRSCPRCHASRWELDKHTGEEKQGIPAKVLRYFPIKERFRRMYRSKRLSDDLRWHSNNASTVGTMRHPMDSLTWGQVNDQWPEFAAEPRNLRLGLSTDENIMLTLLIPGPTAPSNNIDVYLQLLVDDLKDLWHEGIEVYDLISKENFNLRAMLLWTISDYPGLGTLAGCKVKGKQACNVCGKDTPFRWLKEELIAEGTLYSTDSKELLNNIPLGPNAAIVTVSKVVKEGDFLWRPSVDMILMGDALHENIAWPLHKIKFIRQQSGHESVSKNASPKSTSVSVSVSNSPDTSNCVKNKCILLDCSGTDERVAEGRVCSTNLADHVHFVPLGPNASKVWVEVCKVQDAPVWRPNSEVEIISDALGTTVAWPNDKLLFI